MVSDLLGLQATIGNQAVSRLVQRAVGFEFEDPSWTVFSEQSGKQFRTPYMLEWLLGGYFDTIAPPHVPRNDKYKGENVYQSAGAHINNKVGKFNLESPVKKGAIHQGVDYRIEPDGPYAENGVTNRMDLEFVTEPFPEDEAGFGRLVAALSDMEAVFNRFTSHATGEWSGEDFDGSKFVAPSTHGFSDNSVYLYGGVNGGDFKPQVTAGFALADVPDMMESLGTGRGETLLPDEERTRREAVRGMVYGSAAKQRGEAVLLTDAAAQANMVMGLLIRDNVVRADAPGVDSLKGLVALALEYIIALSSPDREGIKTRLPLMSRYSFATLFGQLPKPIQDALKSANGRQSFVGAMSAGIAGKVKGATQDMTGRMIATSTIYRGQSSVAVPDLMTALGTFTRSDWLLNVLDGRDLLTPADLLAHLQREAASPTEKSAAKQYDKSIAIYLRGHGASGSVKDVAGEETGSLSLLENRAIAPTLSGMNAVTNRTAMSFGDVKEMALNYFLWVWSIKRKRAEVAAREEAQKRRLEEDSLKRRRMNLWG
jgi:hypothetical protein